MIRCRTTALSSYLATRFESGLWRTSWGSFIDSGASHLSRLESALTINGGVSMAVDLIDVSIPQTVEESRKPVTSCMRPHSSSMERLISSATAGLS